MAEWLFEAGIGEARAALVSRGRIWKARIEVEASGPHEGMIARARLIERTGPRTGKVALPDRQGEALVEPLPPGITQRASLTIRIVREGIVERGRRRLPKAVPAEGAPRPGPTLRERIAATGIPVIDCHAHQPDAFEAAGWSEVLDEAITGDIAFPGGWLRMAVTPAMTLFDVDGAPPHGALSIAAAHAAAQAIERHGIGGSIGIDFPTLADKAERNAAAAALDAALPQPFERTAINGFGFLQVVRRRIRASLPEAILADPVGHAARAALRIAERVPPPVPDTHIVPEPVARWLARRPDLTDELTRRSGVAARFVAEEPR
ncbi:ribonuclease [Sphingomonas spermidinifaciens]|uniref:Ribonuclease n=1 Tax=Sphingomonas spermidinifaciens TaxID=1141889 RepID=A0A2A4B8P6_9SPHN|nr:ribonuclease [Sphingomonas spermidinifaciens]PCD04440.1 ribonuclease [Sphingomonas spermidinifaciens]